MEKMEDPKVKAAIRLLKAKGITLNQIEEVYKYYDNLGSNKNYELTNSDFIKK